jgi:uncharacterized delta-60 repeat protein
VGTNALPAWGHGGTAWAMTALADGGFALAGDAVPAAGQPADAWLAVTDARGAVQWQARYGGTAFDNARALRHLADGDFVLAGTSNSQGAGLRDGYVVRTDATGKVRWATTWGGKFDDEFHALAVMPDGKLVAAGQTHSQGAGKFDAWLVGLSADGAVLWETTFGHGLDDDATAVVAVPAGGILAAGAVHLDGAIREDLWILRADAKGAALWQKNLGGKLDDRAWAAEALADGGFAVLGETATAKNPDNGIDFWLLRLDAAGNLLWDATYGGIDAERGYGLAPMADGGFALTGYTGTFGEGLWSTWAVRTNTVGKVLWQQAFGTADMDHARAAVALPDGGIALAGRIYDPKFGADQALLVRADRWGSQTCQAAGSCDTLALSDCDIGNPCMIVGCSVDTKVGCQGAAAPDGTWCGEGKVCNAGVCLSWP